MRLLLLSCCLLAVTACNEKVTGPTVSLNTEFTLAPGDAATIEGASLRVRFNHITSDNRCPADVVCILGGSADVNITAVSDNSTRAYVLKTGDMQPVQHAGYSIALVQVAPYPFSSRTIQPAEYRVTLRVTR